jgi:hypothetical protein
MDVILRRLRHVEIHHVGEAADVDPPGRDVGGDEDSGRSGLELREGQRALGLAAVAVDALGADSAPCQRVGQTVGSMLGPREDQHAPHGGMLEEVEEQWHLELLPDHVGGVRDADGRGGRTLGVDSHRFAQEAARQGRDGGRERRREEHGLPG